MKKHEEDGKRAGQFGQIANENGERGFRVETIYDLIRIAALKCLEAKTTWQMEENFGGA